MPYNFAPDAQDEDLVYGACRPEHRQAPKGSTVGDWLTFMQDRGVERVCCLLDERQLALYDDLLGTYANAFGQEDVCHAPIPDFQTVDRDTFEDVILPFLEESVSHEQPVVVHCSAGSGRTGHVLVGWLVRGRKFSLSEALESVQRMGRNPLEAASQEELVSLFQ